MENRKAPTMKSTSSYWIAFTAALALVAAAVMHLGGLGPRPDSTAPEAVQSAAAATQPTPAAPSGQEATRGTASYALANVFIYGDQIAGETNFRPTDLSSGDCRATEMGKRVESMTLFQDLGAQTPLTADLMKAYTAGSTLALRNVRLVSGDSPYIVADARIVPKDATGPFPAYLEMSQARFKWALPVSDVSGYADPLILCNNYV